MGRLGAVIGAGLLVLALGVGCEQVQQVAEFVDNISDGAPCDGNLQCLGGKCLTDEQGYPGGYCTTINCEESGCYGLFAQCFRAEVPGSDATTACYETCNYDGSCDRAAEGYQCVTLADTPVCLPPGVTNAPIQGAVGSSCSATAQCNGDAANCMQTFFGGYCVVLGCSSEADCPDSNPCVPLNPEGINDAEKQFACMAGCSSDSDCRFGYSCQQYEGAMICLEDDGEDSTTRNPDGKDDGEACVTNINCKGGTCISEAESASGDPSYPGGYCTTRDCDADDDCNGADSVCISRERTTSCRVQCESTSDCRQGYECREGSLGKKYCDSVAEPVATIDENMVNAIEVTCSSSKTIKFTIPDGAEGFFIAPYTKQNQRVDLRSLKKPDGSVLDIQKDYKFLAVNADILGNLAPIMFPGSDAGEFRGAFGGGDYELVTSTAATEICYYVVPQMAQGTKLELNMYFVGVPGVSAASAASDSDIQAIMRVMKQIYGSMDVEVSVKDYIDVSSDVAGSYGIIRDFYDVFNLVATSTSPGETTSDALSVNVFLIQDFSISDAPGLLGVSTGIPGMAGLHGSSGSGLVFSTASLGTDNATLGQTLAHEVGHFLGLRHTTEHLGLDHDPITDTPECRLPDLAFLCNDATNFMFPFSLGGDQQTGVTAGQEFVLRRNPLIQP